MPRPLKEFVQRWIITTVAVLVAAHAIPGRIHYDNWQALLVATLVLGLLNAFLKPVLMFLSMPLLIVTLGLFTLVINALLLMFVGYLISGFHVEGFGAAFWGALIISLVAMALNILTGTGNTRVTVRRSRPRRPPRRRDGDNGPIIDV